MPKNQKILLFKADIRTFVQHFPHVFHLTYILNQDVGQISRAVFGTLIFFQIA